MSCARPSTDFVAIRESGNSRHVEFVKVNGIDITEGSKM